MRINERKEKKERNREERDRERGTKEVGKIVRENTAVDLLFFFLRKENREGDFHQYQFVYYSGVFQIKYEKVLL